MAPHSQTRPSSSLHKLQMASLTPQPFPKAPVQESSKKRLQAQAHYLDECEDPWDLCESITHSILGELYPLAVEPTTYSSLGWLACLQDGFLHRDVSMRNVLKFIRPVERNAFSTNKVLNIIKSIKGEIIDSSSTDSQPIDLGPARSMAGNDTRLVELVDKAESVQELAKLLDIGVMCKAAIHDGDSATKLFNLNYCKEKRERTSVHLSVSPHVLLAYNRACLTAAMISRAHPNSCLPSSVMHGTRGRNTSKRLLMTFSHFSGPGSGQP